MDTVSQPLSVLVQPPTTSSEIILPLTALATTPNEPICPVTLEQIPQHIRSEDQPLAARAVPSHIKVQAPVVNSKYDSEIPDQISNQDVISTVATRAQCHRNYSRQVRQKSRKQESVLGTANASVTTLKAVEVKKYIHLWNMESEAEEVQEYLRILCPTGTCTVDKLTPKGSYKSYKVGVPVAYYDKCLSGDVWPFNARIKA